MSVSNTRRTGIIGFGPKQSTGVTQFSNVGFRLSVGKTFQWAETLEKRLGIGNGILRDVFFQGAAYQF